MNIPIVMLWEHESMRSWIVTKFSKSSTPRLDSLDIFFLIHYPWSSLDVNIFTIVLKFARYKYYNYRPQRKLRKVTFSEASLSLSTEEGASGGGV